MIDMRATSFSIPWGIHRHLFRVLIGLLSTLTVSYAPLPIASAADNQFNTSVAARVEYTDNIFLDADHALSDSIYTVAPRLEWVRNGERLSVQADGMAECYRYQDNDEYDDVDQWYNAALNYQPNERWQLSIAGHASDDNRPDRDIETTGMVLSNIRRKRFNTAVTASYRLSEITTAGIQAAVNREDFDDPGTSDRKDYSIALFMNRSLEAWLAGTTGRVNAVFSHYDFDREYDFSQHGGWYDSTYAVEDRSAMDNYSVTLGSETALSEKLDFSVDLGGRYARWESESTTRQWISFVAPLNLFFSDQYQEFSPERNHYDSWGFVGVLELSYRGERSDGSLLLSHDLTPVSGENGTANRTTVRIGGGMRFLEKLRGNAAIQWYHNKSEQKDSARDIDTQTWNLQTGIGWELNRHVTVSGNYVYTLYDKGDAEATAYRNKFYIQLVAEHDWLD